MIGMYKPSTKTNWKTLAIGKDPNIILNHYLEQNASLISHLDVDGTPYSHLLGKYDTITEASESCLYNQILELENINLYELCKEIKRKKRYCFGC